MHVFGCSIHIPGSKKMVFDSLLICYMLSSELQQQQIKCTSHSAACGPLRLPVGVVISCRRMARGDYFLSCSCSYCQVRSAVPIAVSHMVGTEETSRSPPEWEMGQKQNTQLLLPVCFCLAKLKCVVLWKAVGKTTMEILPTQPNSVYPVMGDEIIVWCAFAQQLFNIRG